MGRCMPQLLVKHSKLLHDEETAYQVKDTFGSLLRSNSNHSEASTTESQSALQALNNYPTANYSSRYGRPLSAAAHKPLDLTVLCQRRHSTAGLCAHDILGLSVSGLRGEESDDCCSDLGNLSDDSQDGDAMPCSGTSWAARPTFARPLRDHRSGGAPRTSILSGSTGGDRHEPERRSMASLLRRTGSSRTSSLIKASSLLSPGDDSTDEEDMDDFHDGASNDSFDSEDEEEDLAAVEYSILSRSPPMSPKNRPPPSELLQRRPQFRAQQLCVQPPPREAGPLRRSSCPVVLG